MHDRKDILKLVKNGDKRVWTDSEYTVKEDEFPLYVDKIICEREYWNSPLTQKKRKNNRMKPKRRVE